MKAVICINLKQPLSLPCQISTRLPFVVLSFRFLLRMVKREGLALCQISPVTVWWDGDTLQSRRYM